MEEPLPSGGSCLLGSINLAEFVTEYETFDFVGFKDTVKKAVVALNEVLDEGLPLHPLIEQRESVKNWRQIGLGVMGLADMFIKLGIKYGSEESIKWINMIGTEMIFSALESSNELTVSKGAYPMFNTKVVDTPFFQALNTKENNLRYQELRSNILLRGLCNSQLLTCAPTGSIATMLGISTGCEPIFATSYTRKTESLVDKEKLYKVYTPIIQNNFISKGVPEDQFPEYVVTSENIPYIERIQVQAALQKYIDASISSTINLPESATIDDVERIYRLAWEHHLKGVTVYRAGCKRGAILSKKPTGNKELMKRPESIDAKLIRFKNRTENWIAFVGLVDDRPYEVFTGINNIEDFPIPSTITEGKIIKVKDEFGKRYDFQYVDKYGYTNRLGGLSRIFNQEYWNYAKLISALLRGGIELDKVVKIIDGMHFESDTLNTWKNGVKRAIKTFIVNGTESHELCPDCGDHLIYEGGCTMCKSCGFSRCI